MNIFFIEYQLFNSNRRHIFKIFDQPLVRKIKCMRVFPIVMCNFLQPLNYIGIMHFYGGRFHLDDQKLSRCKINGAYNCRQPSTNNILPCKFRNLSFCVFYIQSIIHYP